MSTSSKGREAEERAAQFLMDKGYTIVTRNYCIRGGEIDIVALDGETLVFVEVKERLAPGFIPEHAVREAKFASMIKAADHFRKAAQDSRQFRYDLIAIDGNGLRHYEACFGSGWGEQR